MEINQITETIIGSANTVSNTLGAGFLEKVYENALALEICKQGLRIEQQFRIHVLYDNTLVGEYIADLLVENKVLVEVKAIKAFENVHLAQCLNYLKGTGLQVCL